METKNEKGSSQLTLTRVFNAPRELVFKAFTEADRMAKWWGPKGSEITIKKLDLRPGGVFHYSMAFGDNTIWGLFIYREIVAPVRLVFVNCFSDKDGNKARSPFHPVWPLEILNTFTFTKQDGKTTLTIIGGPINASQQEVEAFEANIGNLQTGFKGTFDALDEYLATYK